MRHRNHITEDRSRALFRASAPPSLVIRDETPDYGYDLQIELFDGYGRPEGVRILVQLKATNSTAAGPPSIRLKTERLQMYVFRSPLPVVVVGVDLAASTLSYRWPQEILLNLDPQRASEKSITLRLDAMRPLDETGWTALLDSARWHDKARIPLGYALEDELGAPRELSWVEHQLAAVSTRLRMSPPVVAAGEFASVKFTRREAFQTPPRLEVAFRLGPGEWIPLALVECSAPLREGPSRVGKIHLQVATACAIRLLGKGKGGLWTILHALPARDVLEILYSQLGIGLCIAFAQDGCLEKVLVRILEASDHLDTERFEVVGMASLWLRTPSLNLLWIALFNRLAIESSDPSTRAMWHYNSANVSASVGDWHGALQSLCAARKFWPDYGLRAYWCQELGVALFELRFYRQAEKAYLAALCYTTEPANEDWLRLCLADVALRIGDPESAANYFDAVVTWPDPLEYPHWPLRSRLSEFLVSFGFSTKHRKSFSRVAVVAEPDPDFVLTAEQANPDIRLQSCATRLIEPRSRR
jgi:hypothetical protein